MNVAYNMDCMEYMRTLPDNAFDLAVVDPPYGDGCSQSLNVERERERERGGRYNRFGGWWNRYKVEQVRTTVRQIQDESSGGGWHGKDKYHLGELEERGQVSTAKKLLRGMLPRRMSILMSFSASHATRSFGAVTTSAYLLHVVS